MRFIGRDGVLRQSVEVSDYMMRSSIIKDVVSKGGLVVVEPDNNFRLSVYRKKLHGAVWYRRPDGVYVQMSPLADVCVKELKILADEHPKGYLCSRVTLAKRHFPAGWKDGMEHNVHFYYSNYIHPVQLGL